MKHVQERKDGEHESKRAKVVQHEMMLESDFLKLVIHWVSFDLGNLLVDEFSWDSFHGCNLHEPAKEDHCVVGNRDVEQGRQDHDLLRIYHIP